MIPVTLSPSSWAEAWVADAASGFGRDFMMLVSMMSLTVAQSMGDYSRRVTMWPGRCRVDDPAR
jgi:hypothetical protein